MVQLNPYLSFKGNCREAMSFYKECFGGELSIMTFGDSPVADQMPADKRDHVMHSDLKAKDGLVLMASDASPEELQKGNTVTLALICSSEDEIRTLFSHLSTDGEVGQPLETAFWGGIFGTLTDKFGVKWMFNYEKK
ncbi:MAG: VOC family protein [Candidatus Sericytochromatia bacterium]